MGKKAVPDDIKWQIIGLSKDKNKTQVEIAKLCKVSRCCVQTTLRNYKETKTVSDLPRSGRPPKLSLRDQSYLFKETRINPRISLRRLTANFNSKFENHSVNKDTVRKSLNKSGIGSYQADRKPLLSILDRIKRRKWCKERLHWTVEDWSRVIFSDESNFEVINRKSRVIVKRLKSERYLARFCAPRVTGGGGSAGIWGCISHSMHSQISRGWMLQNLYRSS